MINKSRFFMFEIFAINVSKSFLYVLAIDLICSTIMGGDLAKARDKLRELMYIKGVAGVDLIRVFQRELIRMQLDDDVKAEVAELLSEVDYRLTQGADEEIQLMYFLMVIALIEKKPRSIDEALKVLEQAKNTLAKTRPTAVNLFWALDRMYNKAVESASKTASVNELLQDLEEEAKRIFEEELEAEIRMGIYGAEFLENGDTVLTICNAGGLATGTGIGTATAPIYIATALGKQVSVIAPETRPWQQGARLTVYELMQNGIRTTLIADTAVGLVMYKKLVNVVMVGADRILLDGHDKHGAHYNQSYPKPRGGQYSKRGQN